MIAIQDDKAYACELLIYQQERAQISNIFQFSFLKQKLQFALFLRREFDGVFFSVKFSLQRRISWTTFVTTVSLSCTLLRLNFFSSLCEVIEYSWVWNWNTIFHDTYFRNCQG